MVRFTHGEPVTWVRVIEGETDSYGNPTTSTEDTIIENCGVAPRVEAEQVGDNRAMVINGYDIYTEFGIAVGSHDRIVVRGEVCEVDGDVAHWRSPWTGWQAGSVIRVKRVEG